VTAEEIAQELRNIRERLVLLIHNVFKYAVDSDQHCLRMCRLSMPMSQQVQIILGTHRLPLQARKDHEATELETQLRGRKIMNLVIWSFPNAVEPSLLVVP
jgi:hypothetical protein